MAAKRKRCKVCEHKMVAEINSKIRNGEPISRLCALYGISRNTIMKHRDNCLTDILAKDDAARDAMQATGLKNDMEELLTRVRKLFDAYDRQLQDPDNPDQYDVSPRANEIDIIYRDFDKETGKQSQITKKANFQQLLDTIYTDGRFIIQGITHSKPDHGDMLLKTATKLENSIKLLDESTRKAIEWEHKKAAMEKLQQSDNVEVSFEKQVAVITEKVTLAVKESNTEELSALAGLPELN
ncbi:MAG: hypothetical protein PQJ59_16840 [Spirochaetales bacterium]|nr:hypothetical protein [Spirochaetales bacterium]